MMKLLIIALCMAAASANSLNSDNYASATAGKTVFIKFLAPWCGHCKSMKPAWDKLMEENDAVFDVDCTADGQSLCSEQGVQGYPTIKWGSPDALEDYQGGRSFDDLKKFADENLKPSCSPANIDLCDDDKKAEIEKLQAMSDDDLDSAISEKEGLLKEAEETFEAEVKKLQNKYESLQEDKKKAQEEVKESGLGMLKAVKAAKNAAAKEEL